MSSHSRRNFLAAGLSLPAAGLAAGTGQSKSSPPARLQSQPASALRYRTLGKTGLKVTAVSFGCMITSDGSVIERAADAGINYFDTARGYQDGNNERMVGAALKAKRKSLVLSSKTHSDTKEAALADLDISLKTLGTDYLDIWFLHARSRAVQVNDEFLEAQRIAKKAGKIRFAGVSTHSGQAEVIPATVKAGLDVVLVAYNFTMGSTLDGVMEAAAKAGAGVVAMKVMAGGFRRVNPGNALYGKLKRDGAMVAALKWVLRNQNVAAAIPSITDADQLDDNLKVMGAAFTESDEKLLAQQLEHITPLYCRMCGQCDGQCPQGVPVADVLRFLTYADGYGQFALARERYLELPERVAQVKCNLCPSCTVTCPYGVRVAERLIRAQEMLA
jgi:aryl-alcohol dehydrogenase-like predicted oxidoreductase